MVPRPRIRGMKLALALLCLSTAAWAGPAPWIGLSLEEGDSGARVRQVMENSPGQRAGIKEGEQVVALDATAAANVAGAAESYHVTYPLASDAGEIVSRTYRVYALPTMVIIDRQGIVREVSIADPEAADAAVEAALRGAK